MQLINYERLSISARACAACSTDFSGQVPPQLYCIPANEARKLNACQTVDGQVVSCRQVSVQLSFVSDAPSNSYAYHMVRTNVNDRRKMCPRVSSQNHDTTAWKHYYARSIIQL